MSVCPDTRTRPQQGTGLSMCGAGLGLSLETEPPSGSLQGTSGQGNMPWSPSSAPTAGLDLPRAQVCLALACPRLLSGDEKAP